MDFKSITMILNPGDYPNQITPGVIAHESTHVKNIIFKDIGQFPDLDNDEAEAYLMEWIVETVTNFYYNEDNKKANEAATQ